MADIAPAPAALTARTITDAQIRLLRSDAAAHGDLVQVRICDLALARRGGRGECARVINDACGGAAV